jgi:hypothetical protein
MGQFMITVPHITQATRMRAPDREKTGRRE